MGDETKIILSKIQSYLKEDLHITDYCREKMKDRNIDESLLINTLFSRELYYVREQIRMYLGVKENRYKLIFKISSRYSLIIIVKFDEKVLKVLNVIKTSKKAEKWKKKMLK